MRKENGGKTPCLEVSYFFILVPCFLGNLLFLHRYELASSFLWFCFSCLTDFLSLSSSKFHWGPFCDLALYFLSGFISKFCFVVWPFPFCRGGPFSSAFYASFTNSSFCLLSQGWLKARMPTVLIMDFSIE